MVHRRIGLGIEQIDIDAVPAQGLVGQRLHELLRRRCHHDAHFGSRLDQQAHQLGGLVSGDTAGDPEQDFLVAERFHLIYFSG